MKAEEKEFLCCLNVVNREEGDEDGSGLSLSPTFTKMWCPWRGKGGRPDRRSRYRRPGSHPSSGTSWLCDIRQVT